MSAASSPLYLVIYESKQRIRLSLGITEDPATFDRDLGLFLPSNPHFRLLNERMTRIRGVADTGLREMLVREGNLDDYCDYITERLKLPPLRSRKPAPCRFIPYYERWSVETTTRRKYSRQRVQSYRIFREFVNDDSITFSRITYRLCEEFIEWMATVKGLKPNTRGNHVKNLKACMNEAYLLKMHGNTDYRRFRKEREETDSIYLTDAEVDMIAALPLHGTLADARDLFLIGCHTGLRFSDYSRLTMDDITDGIIHNVNVKTGISVDIPAHPEVVAILRTHGGIAPLLSDQKLNMHIKTVCRMAGLTERVCLDGEWSEKWENVSSHTARRTGLTNMYKAGVPVYRCMMISGHRSERTFLTYLKITSRENAETLKDNPFFN